MKNILIATLVSLLFQSTSFAACPETDITEKLKNLDLDGEMMMKVRDMGSQTLIMRKLIDQESAVVVSDLDSNFELLQPAWGASEPGEDDDLAVVLVFLRNQNTCDIMAVAFADDEVVGGSILEITSTSVTIDEEGENPASFSKKP